MKIKFTMGIALSKWVPLLGYNMMKPYIINQYYNILQTNFNNNILFIKNPIYLHLKEKLNNQKIKI